MRWFGGFASPRRLLLITAGLLVALALALVGHLPIVQRHILRWAESRLTLAVGREVRAERVSLRLWQGRLELHRIRVAGGPGIADGTTLLTADAIRLGWSWAALLRRSLLVDPLVLVGPRLTLPTTDASAPSSHDPFFPVSGTEPGALTGWTVEIRSAAIEDGQVIWGPPDAVARLDGVEGSVEWRRGPDGQASAAGSLRASRLQIPSGGALREITQLRLEATGNAHALDITSAEGLVAGGRVTAKGRILKPMGPAECDLRLALSLPLETLLRHAGVSVAHRGLLGAEGRLSGSWARMAFHGQASLQLDAASQARKPLSFAVQWADGRLTLDTPSSDRSDSLWARLVLEPATGAYRANLRVQQVDLGDLTGAPALVAAAAGLSLPPEVGGRLTADVDLTGRGTDLATLRGYGRVRVDDLSLEAGLPSGRLEARLLATTSRLTLERFTLDIPGATVQGTGSVRFPAGELDFPVQADIRSVAAFGRGFGLPLLGGTATLGGRLNGTRDAPRFQGRVAWRDPRFGLHALDQIEGEIEWVPRTLRSSRLVMRLGQTVATLQGSVSVPGTTPLRKLDFRRDLTLDLQGQVNPGRTADLAPFLPAGLPIRGAFQASGRIAGTPQSLTGEVEVAFINPQTWTEKWQRGDAVLRLTPTALEIARLSLRRGGEQLTGDVRIGHDGTLSGQLASTSMDLGKMALLAGSQVTGRASFQLDVQGTRQEPRIAGKGMAEALLFRNVPLGPGPVAFTHYRDAVDLDVTLRQGSQRLRLRLGPSPERTLRLDLALADADLAPLFQLAGIEGLRTTEARGTGRILMDGKASDFAEATGEATFSGLRLRLADEPWENRGPVEISWKGEDVSLRQARLHSQDRDLDIRGTVTGKDRIDLQVTGQVPLAALSPYLPGVKPVAGTARADLRVRGTLQAPELQGTLDFAGGKLTLGNLAAPFQDVQGTAALETGRARVQAFRARIAGGTLQGTGEASWRGDDWTFQCAFQEEGARAEQLLAGLFQGHEITGLLSLGGTLASQGQGAQGFWPNLDGGIKFALRDGQLGRQTLMVRLLSLIDVAQLLDPKALAFSSQGIPYRRLTADIQIEDGVARTENLLLEGPAFTLSAHGHINLANEVVRMDIAVKPFQTVDRLVTKIPVAGWLLGGKDGSVIAAFYRVTGTLSNPTVESLPLQSVGRNVFGAFRRLLDLPEALSGP
jgi:autotransporter translocation and assembly factor TamB